MVNDIVTTQAGARDVRGPHHRGDEPHLLREILRTYQALMAGFSRGAGMPSSRFLIARLLRAAGDEGLGTMELARQLGVNPAAVTRQLNEMAREGLVRRRADSRDKRRSYARLTSRGQAAFETAHRRAHEFERAIASALGDEEMRAAASLLEKVRAFVEAYR